MIPVLQDRTIHDIANKYSTFLHRQHGCIQQLVVHLVRPTIQEQEGLELRQEIGFKVRMTSVWNSEPIGRTSSSVVSCADQRPTFNVRNVPDTRDKNGTVSSSSGDGQGNKGGMAHGQFFRSRLVSLFGCPLAAKSVKARWPSAGHSGTPKVGNDKVIFHTLEGKVAQGRGIVNAKELGMAFVVAVVLDIDKVEVAKDWEQLDSSEGRQTL
ncbi:hypothetical protein C8R45DRAFT_941207 [Mycena sanguinolenta]|nr:hypothetical protein C8R45DRAFT_941207 [Mycena sanguinolenta]